MELLLDVSFLSSIVSSLMPRTMVLIGPREKSGLLDLMGVFTGDLPESPGIEILALESNS